MEDTVVNKETVFYPTIKRIKFQNKNNLYELLDILPAKPITPKGDTLENNCDFYPRTDKCYVPKKKTRLKVKTVRDIRKSFEEDTYAYLPSELEKQQSALLKKIRRGSSKDESTKVLARNILKSDIPISRSTWEVLVNLNPEQYLHPQQFIFWNGKNIQVNGSKGGNQKYICHETAASKSQYKNIKAFNNNTSFKKKGLLRNSLSIKFKPGPLGRKKFLDDSHQKYHVGDIELVKLPKPGLDVYPTYGTSLEPTITHFINNLRKEDGTISQKWAEYAVSVLGTFQKSDAVQIVKESVTFDLNYKCDQHRLLMRKDVDTYGVPKALINETVPVLARHEVIVLAEVKDMMTQILDCIEISLNQDNMYTGVDEFKQVNCDEVKEEQTHTKDKLKRKYGELDRLDVTVIRLPEESNINISETCNKPFCSFGCVCNSLESSFNLRGHCGLVDCMFGCICDFSKYTAKDSLDWECELIPDLLNLNHGISSKLAKEEKKFHQTVILTGDRSILLKSHKRNAKAPKKYAEFYKNQNFRNDYHNKQTVSVIALKINCENIEPWCMVHNLYKCFCKGRFIEANEPVGDDTDIKDSTIPKDTIGKNTEVVDLTSRTENKSNKFHTEPYVDCTSTCARVNLYAGRKFNDEYYKDTNEKILNMEKNDTNLRHRMWSIMYKGYSKEKETNKEKKLNNQREINKNNFVAQSEDLLGNTSTNLNQFLSGVNEHIKSNPTNNDLVTTRSKSKLLPNKTKLVAWLESNYKLYKERIDKGITKTSLDPPKAGKVALYPWSFVLSRYRERKNFFLISKQKPYRIFMAVNTKNPIFENCININDIRFAELHTYPVTVKNLLTNATDLKENFCILCGLSDCWELIGSVSKINDGHVNMMGHKETSDTESVDPFNINPTWGDKSSLESKFNDKESFEINVDGPSSDITVEEEKQCVENFAQSADSSISSNHLDIAASTFEFSHDADTSKWFVMTVEKDFSEIRFYKRGFFVKYESIVKAINVARMSGKTVRLSSQKCIEKSSGPQFGIYAIPNGNEYCVFVGPYEIQDSLGIETIKTSLDVRNLKSTRGFWITTNKIDNLKVIDNPLSFMNSVQNSKTVPLDFHSEAIDKTGLGFEEKQSQDSEEAKKTLPSTSKESIKKIVKPIKIRKTNGFYHLDSNGLLKKNVSSPDEKTKREPLRSSDNIDENVMGTLLKISHVRPYKRLPQTTSPIKITTVYSIGKEDKPTKSDRTEKGMFILKPEEINRKLFENKLISTSTTQSEGDLNSLFDEEQDIDMDSEQSLTDSSMCNASNDNNLDNYVCVISDEEGSCTTYKEEKVSVHRKVWIECITEKMGWIHALRNEMDQLSFKLPACEYSEFYPEQEAFDKINEELSTRFGLPSADFTWKVVENEDTLSGPEINFSDHILFSKQESRPSNIKTYCRTRRKTAGPALAKTFTAEFNDKTDSPSEQINPEDLPFQSSSANSSKFIHIIRNAPDTLKHLMTDTLKSILSMSQDLDEEGQS